MRRLPLLTEIQALTAQGVRSRDCDRLTCLLHIPRKPVRSYNRCRQPSRVFVRELHVSTSQDALPALVRPVIDPGGPGHLRVLLPDLPALDARLDTAPLYDRAYCRARHRSSVHLGHRRYSLEISFVPSRALGAEGRMAAPPPGSRECGRRRRDFTATSSEI